MADRTLHASGEFDLKNYFANQTEIFGPKKRVLVLNPRTFANMSKLQH